MREARRGGAREAVERGNEVWTVLGDNRKCAVDHRIYCGLELVSAQMKMWAIDARWR